ERFGHRAALAGPAPEKTTGALPFFFSLGSKTRAQCERNGPPPDPRGCNEAGVERADVHRPPFTATVAGGASGNFCHEPFDVGSLGDGVAVRAMAAENTVVGSKQATGSYRDGFLADTQVEQTHDLTHRVKRRDLFFERPNEPHFAEERHELGWFFSISCHDLSKVWRECRATSGVPRESLP